MTVSNSIVLNAFLSGAIALGFGVIAVRFQQFWRHTRIRLFHLFSLAFLFLGIERIMEVLVGGATEVVPHLYLLRLAAFALIILAIVNHNRRRS